MRSRSPYKKAQLYSAIFLAFLLLAFVGAPRRTVHLQNAIAQPTPAATFPLPIDPAQAIATSEFGPRQSVKTATGFSSSNHRGLDLACAVGDPLVAVRAGELVYDDHNPKGWGMAAILKSEGDEFVYAHLSARDVENHAKVKPGDAIAQCGQSGGATGPHLHFELRPGGGAPVNPRKFLEELGLPGKSS